MCAEVFRLNAEGIVVVHVWAEGRIPIVLACSRSGLSECMEGESEERRKGWMEGGRESVSE